VGFSTGESHCHFGSVLDPDFLGRILSEIMFFGSGKNPEYNFSQKSCSEGLCLERVKIIEFLIK